MVIIPKSMQVGNFIATVSPSWGGAGDQGVKRLAEIFGLTVIAMPNSLKGTE